MKYEFNKTYNVDSYVAIKDIPDKSIDCIYTDIPYLYFKGGEGNSPLGKRAMKKKKELKNLNIEDGIDYKILYEFKRIMKKTNIFIWCSKSQINEIMNIMNEEKVNFELLVWCKTNPQPTTNNTWLPDLEYCLYFREKGVKLNNGYHLKSKYDISSINKTDKELYHHPTIKPLNMIRRHLEHATQVGDLVFDPFHGSGTVGEACRELERDFIAFEIDEKHCKTANDRYNGINANGQTSIFTFL